MIQHVTRQIPPAQVDQCVQFYSILGFEPVPVPASVAGRAVWLGRSSAATDQTAGATTRAAGEAQIHLMPADYARPEQGHVAFVIEDYAATVARLRDAGFDVEARREHWGSPRAYVRDPASNLVELMAWAPDERPE
jgi:catechol 2,3-dioxygenase-like lactoylglutathione lyase family enzyme